jgi:hypothetical protein
MMTGMPFTETERARLEAQEAKELLKSHGIVRTFDYAWVHQDRRQARYVVYRNTVTHSESDSAYPLNDDGLSLALVRARYVSDRIAKQVQQ